MTETAAMEEVLESFVLPESLDIAILVNEVKMASDKQHQDFVRLSEAYRRNLTRIHEAAMLPYRMAWIGVMDVYRESLYHRCRFKAADQLDPRNDDFGSAVEKLAHQLTIAEFKEFFDSEVGKGRLDANAQRQLTRLANFRQLALLRAAQDLLLQSTISVWAAFETFVTDYVRSYLNLRPGALSLLLADEDAKKRLGKTKWSLADLLDLGPDLSGRIGDLALSENDLSDLLSMKAILIPLSNGNQALRLALDSPELLLLGRLRNVLAHRGGLVDARFERETNARWKVGETVTVRTKDLRTFCEATARVVVLLLESSAHIGESPDSAA